MIINLISMMIQSFFSDCHALKTLVIELKNILKNSNHLTLLLEILFGKDPDYNSNI